jgi:hypothetical protein
LQSQGELKERKSKEMKAKLLSFLFINFSESRLFRALRRKKQKNPGPSYSPLRLRVKGLGRPQTDRPASAIRAHFAAPPANRALLPQPCQHPHAFRVAPAETVNFRPFFFI